MQIVLTIWVATALTLSAPPRSDGTEEDGPIPVAEVGGEDTRSSDLTDDYKNMSQLYTEIRHPDGGTTFGHYLMPAGDLNGDGAEDLLQWRISHSSLMYMLLGSKERDFHHSRIVEYSGLKWFLPVGDINGDGKDDVVCSSNPDTWNPYNNRVGELPAKYYVRYGCVDGLPHKNDDTLSIWPEHSNGSRWVLLTFEDVGDVNGDGFADLLLYATDQDPYYHYTEPNYPQELQLYYGTKDGFGSNPGFTADLTKDDQNWTNIRGAGKADFNGDGCSDIFFVFRNLTSPPGVNIGQPNREIRIHYGAKSGLSLRPHKVLIGNQSSEYLYSYMVMRYNRDDYDDLVITRVVAKNNDWANRTYDLIVYNGSKSGLGEPWKIIEDGDYPYISGSRVLDLNGDGADDFVVMKSDRINQSREEGLPDWRYVPRMNLHLEFFFNRDGRFPDEPDTSYSLWNVSPYSTNAFSCRSGGDYDGDGNEDLCIPVGGIVIGVPPFTGGRLAWPGPTFIFFGSGITFLKEPMRLSEKGRLYAGLKHYEFLVRDDPRGYGASDEVRLTLDPDGADVKISWKRHNPLGSRWNVDEGSDLVHLNSSDIDFMEGGPTEPAFLRFKVMFDWDWPHEAPCDVKVTYINGTGFSYSFDLVNAFGVENDLQLTGDIRLQGEFQGPLEPGQWVRGGERLDLTGARVVYQGTTDVFPPSGTCNITMRNDEGDVTGRPSQGSAIHSLSLLADDETDRNEEIVLALEDLPGTAEAGPPRTFLLKVDAEPPRLTNAIPDSNDWMSTNDVLVAIVADDDGASGVDIETLEYSFEGPAGIKDWRQLDLRTDWKEGRVEASTFLNLPDGTGYWVMWRANDMVGNGYNQTDRIPIRVDTRNLTFTNPIPGEDEWQNTSSVRCGVTLRDLRGSGVDVSTVQYRFSFHNVTSYGPWTVWDTAIEDRELVEARVDIVYEDGKYNYIQWRASDVAGNGITVSPHYRVLVDTQPVTFTGFWPDTVQNTTDVTVSVKAHKGAQGSDILEDSCKYRYRSGDGPYSAWMSAFMNKQQHEDAHFLAADLEGLEDGSHNFVQFQVYDLARNGPAISPEYQVTVDTTGPFIVHIDPGEDEIQREQRVSVNVTFGDALSGVDPVTVLLRYSTAGLENFREWRVVSTTIIGDNVTCTFQIRFDLGNDNLVQFRLSDVLGNEAVTDPWTIWVNRIPMAVLSTPVAGMNHSSDEALALNASGSYDPDEQALKYEWYYDHELVSTNERAKLDGPFEPGTHLVELYVIDPLGAYDKASVFVETVEGEGPEAPEPRSMNVGLLVMAIVVLVSGAVAFHLWRRGTTG